MARVKVTKLTPRRPPFPNEAARRRSVCVPKGYEWEKQDWWIAKKLQDQARQTAAEDKWKNNPVVVRLQRLKEPGNLKAKKRRRETKKEINTSWICTEPGCAAKFETMKELNKHTCTKTRLTHPAGIKQEPVDPENSWVSQSI